MNNNERVKEFKASEFFHDLKYLPLNGLMTSLSKDLTVNVWDPYTGKSIGKFKQPSEYFSCLEQIDADTLVSGSTDGTIHVWRISTGKTLITFNASESIVSYDVAAVLSIKTLSNGLIACGLEHSSDNLRIFNYTTGDLVKTLYGHTFFVKAIEVMSEQFMASGGCASSIDPNREADVIIWDLNSYSIKYVLKGHTEEVLWLKRLSSSLLAISGYGDWIGVWNWLNGTLVHKLGCYGGSLDLYDDQTLISGNTGAKVTFWNISNGQMIKTIKANFRIGALVMLERGKH